MYSAARELPRQTATERDFLKSLSRLSRHYGLPLRDYRALPYPYNILMAERETRRKLQVRGRHRDLRVVETENGRTCLAVRETFDRDFDLYYIPVQPLYDLWQTPGQEPCARLLTAVFACLHREAGVSFYREEDTYLFYTYEILQEWITDGREDMEAEDDERQQNDWHRASLHGDFIWAKMLGCDGLTSLESLIADFQPENGFERSCLTIARHCFALWQDYPGRNLYTHASLKDDEAEDDEDNYIALQEYVSFIGSVDDSISDSLLEMVNNDFNERARFQEPEMLTLFDQPRGRYSDELAFAERLFALIDDVCSLLTLKP